jgi:hypothetical protein
MRHESNIAETQAVGKWRWKTLIPTFSREREKGQVGATFLPLSRLRERVG